LDPRAAPAPFRQHAEGHLLLLSGALRPYESVKKADFCYPDEGRVGYIT